MNDEPTLFDNERPCTCHPDDNPPVPCAKQYALQDCLNAAQQNRDVGIGKISDNNADWLAICVQLFPYCYLDTFTGEDLRHFYEARHLRPTHHNAYGALIRQLLKLELIRATGERRHMKDPQSHSRLTDVYVKL